jgi:hypothetical protein
MSTVRSPRSHPVPAALLVSLILLLVAGPALATRCITPDLPRLDAPADEIRADLESRGLWAVSGDGDRTPPPDPQVGDTWLWYIWDLGGMPQANLKPCTVRGMGDNVYVVVDDEEWNVGMDQADVDQIIERFQNSSVGDFPTQGVWDLNTSHFGDPPNPLDGLDRIFLLYYRFNISSDGFFWVFDQFPDGSQAWASNEADVIYMAVDNGQPAGDYMIGVMAHEFEHLIHYARDTNEHTWMDEGLGELAMWLYGNPDNISSFNTNPDNNLIDWGSAWADYIQTYLWSLYAYEQLGGQPFIWDLVHSPLDGMTGYNSIMSAHGIPMDTKELFGDWVLANFLDDPGIGGGQYGYTGDTLPAFNAFRTHSTYPTSNSGSVQGWAGEYLRCLNVNGVLHLEFDGIDSREFIVSMIGLDATLPTVIAELPLDANNDGSFDFAAAQGYDEVIVSVSNVYNYSGTYSYSLDMVPTDAGQGEAMPVRLAAAYPNPFNPKTSLRFSLDREREIRLSVTDAAGRILRVLADGTRGPGEHVMSWDGRDGAGKALPSGVYFVHLSDSSGLLESRKLVLLK